MPTDLPVVFLSASTCPDFHELLLWKWFLPTCSSLRAIPQVSGSSQIFQESATEKDLPITGVYRAILPSGFLFLAKVSSVSIRNSGSQKCNTIIYVRKIRDEFLKSLDDEGEEDLSDEEDVKWTARWALAILSFLNAFKANWITEIGLHDRHAQYLPFKSFKFDLNLVVWTSQMVRSKTYPFKSDINVAGWTRTNNA